MLDKGITFSRTIFICNSIWTVLQQWGQRLRSKVKAIMAIYMAIIIHNVLINVPNWCPLVTVIGVQNVAVTWCRYQLNQFLYWFSIIYLLRKLVPWFISWFYPCYINPSSHYLTILSNHPSINSSIYPSIHPFTILHPITNTYQFVITNYIYK